MTLQTPPFISPINLPSELVLCTFSLDLFNAEEVGVGLEEEGRSGQRLQGGSRGYKEGLSAHGHYVRHSGLRGALPILENKIEYSLNLSWGAPMPRQKILNGCDGRAGILNGEGFKVGFLEKLSSRSGNFKKQSSSGQGWGVGGGVDLQGRGQSSLVAE